MTAPINDQITAAYNGLKARVLEASSAGDAEACMESVFSFLKFMNRFRNCDLQYYFDEDLNEAIQSLNPRRFDRSALLKNKTKFKIAFIIPNLVDTGGASIPHRFMLDNYSENGVTFEQYILVSNLSGEADYEHTAAYKHISEHLSVHEFEHLLPGMSWLEKGKFIEEWIADRDIDFVFASTCPATIYALASRPALIHSTMSQDCYTFALGPGSGDYTYMVTTDQVFKYRFKKQGSEKNIKVVMLPLHDDDYIDGTEPMDLTKFGIPETATVSATTNMWKVCFGDSDVLLQALALLIRKHPNHHQIFAGTPRCLDNIEAFLSKNPDVKNNIHYVGKIKNIYSLLKSIDFWVNSFPTSGGSDIEAALVNKPTIELMANRNLDLHGAEFLRSRECDAFSIDEFLQLADRFITDPGYRDDLGAFLKTKISREFDKKDIIKTKIYDFFLQKFNEMLVPAADLPELGIHKSIEYEKRIALYSAHGRTVWNSIEIRAFLDDCIENFPSRPFAWIKALEDSIESGDKERFNRLREGVIDMHSSDHRINVLLAIGCAAMTTMDDALLFAQKAMTQATFDEIPARVTARLFFQAGKISNALEACKSIPCLEGADVNELESSLASLPDDQLPLYYDY